jgi:carbamoyltransferase
MKILGIQLGHNSTVALLEEGKITCAVSEEKFDNIKNSSNFPSRSIRWILESRSPNPTDISYIAVSGILIYPRQLELVESRSEIYSKGSSTRDYIKYILAKRFPELYWKYILFKSSSIKNIGKQRLIETLSKVLRLSKKELEEKVILVPHHTCHAYSSLYTFGVFDGPALILTLDGSGDYSCSTVNVYNPKDGHIKRIVQTKWIHSPGYVYSKVTEYLGMKPLEHEYKVMGLAPYAKREHAERIKEKVFKPLLWIHPHKPFEFYSRIPTNRIDYYLKDKLFKERFDNIAGGLQLWLEELVTEWIKNIINATNIRRVFFGGGVFMNVKMNKKIMEMDEIEECYFMPSCGDESNPFGACFYVYKKLTGEHPRPLEDLYLGPSYTLEEVEQFLKERGIFEKYKVEFYEDIEKRVAELLANFKVVARFKGRAEWGQRALGNRSILANPSDMRSFYEVNDAIKQRDFWMPFAPSILDEDEDKYIVNPKKVKAPYMILSFDTTELARNHLKAAMHHRDKTVRPQIVYKWQNPDYWRLINYFKQLTGIGGVLNTSFNLHGYPLVATLEQAIFTFENSGLKYLALENFLISKE